MEKKTKIIKDLQQEVSGIKPFINFVFNLFGLYVTEFLIYGAALHNCMPGFYLCFDVEGD